MFSGIIPTKASNSTVSPNPVNYLGSVTNDLLAQYRLAKDYFYRKQYDEATSLFTQLIGNNQGTLFLYDGLAKVYSARQNMLQVVELYRNGVQHNTGNSYFLHRYGMVLRRLCLGNPAAARQFAIQNEISNLYEYAAGQVLAANVLNPKSIFQLDLKDFPRLLERFNKNLRNSEIMLTLPYEIVLQINTVSSSVSDKWVVTRCSRKPVIPPEATGNSSQGSNNRGGKRHRNLYNDKEREERDKSKRKHKKSVSYHYMRQSFKQKNTMQVERFGMQILAKDTSDTNVVGAMRKYFRRNKNYDRIISLNRYVYAANQNVYSGLALAASLVKYNKNTPSLNEAKRILDSAEPYLSALTPVARASWYLTHAKIRQHSKNNQEARYILLTGLQQTNGCDGVAYTLMEHYAMTFDKKDAAKAITIQKALCNKKVQAINDPVWMHAEQYRKFTNENTVSVTEQIKALTALAKLQKTFRDSGYSATMMEIKSLKTS
jgi:tetratricopeptide (TPR) repeat protein